MLPPFDTLLFDFDGTLAVLNLDFADMRQRLVELTVAQGLPSEELEGLYILEMVDHATNLLRAQHPDLAPVFYRKAHQLIRDIEVAAAYNSTLLPGIEALLETLQQRQIAVGIVTRNCDAAVRIMCPQLDHYCQVLLARDHVERVKPHPAHLQAALTRLGSTPARTIMVGDGALDIQAAKTLNMFAIGVLSGNGTHTSLLAQGADLVLPSASALLEFLPAHRESTL